MVDNISGGDVYFARGGPRDPLAALPRKRDIRKINGMAWSGLAVGADMGVMHVAAPPIQWQREEPYRRWLSRARWRRGLPSSPASMQQAPTTVGAASL